MANAIEKEAIGTTVTIGVCLLIIAAFIWGTDKAIKKKTGGAFGLMGALEVGIGGAVAYKLYKTFGSGGAKAIAADGTIAEAAAATTETAAATTAGTEAAGAGATEATGAAVATDAAETAVTMEEIVTAGETLLPLAL